jgi:hypothetical protein
MQCLNYNLVCQVKAAARTLLYQAFGHIRALGKKITRSPHGLSEKGVRVDNGAGRFCRRSSGSSSGCSSGRGGRGRGSQCCRCSFRSPRAGGMDEKRRD